MKHKHHIVPKHAGGTNDSSNIVELSVAEHAEAHRILFETYDRWEDEIAWKTLSGQIEIDQARRLASSIANKGKVNSIETRMKISISRTGLKDSEETRKYKSERSGVKGKKYYHNGIIEYRYLVGSQPENWILGRLPTGTERGHDGRFKNKQKKERE